MYYFCITRQELTSKVHHHEKQIGKGSFRDLQKPIFPLNETAEVWGEKMHSSTLFTSATNQRDEKGSHCLTHRKQNSVRQSLANEQVSKRGLRLTVQVRSQCTVFLGLAHQ